MIDPSSIKSHIRSLLHNARGSVGIINSSLELLHMEEESETSRKMVEMIRRQTVKLLVELELLTECHAPRGVREEHGGTLLEAIGYASTALNFPLRIQSPLEDPSTLLVDLPHPLLCTLFTALLLKPSPLEQGNTLHLACKDRRVEVRLPWSPDLEELPRLVWFEGVLGNYNCLLQRNQEQACITFPLRAPTTPPHH